MNLPYYHVDAFTGKLFAGNPAGVCLLDEWLPDTLLQSIAAENNLSETSFVVRREAIFELRWFTPLIEVDLCGHATLAAAHVIFQHLAFQGSEISFQTRSGALIVTRLEALLALDFPSRPGLPCSAPVELTRGLGRIPRFVAKARDYLVVFETEEEILELRPEMNALLHLDALGVIVTAPGTDCDFVSRFFAPRAGVPEDPVTGSAHCTLIPYWAKRLGRTKLRARQCSARGGELICEDRGERVTIAGQAVTYASGMIHLKSTGA